MQKLWDWNVGSNRCHQGLTQIRRRFPSQCNLLVDQKMFPESVAKVFSWRGGLGVMLCFGDLLTYVDVRSSWGCRD